MGMKRNFILSVFALFFAIFGGVGVAYAHFPECPEVISIQDLDPDVDNLPIEWGSSTVEPYNPDWYIVLESDRAALKGTSFCSAEDNSNFSTPAMTAGTFCWCGLLEYENLNEGVLYSSHTPTWVYLNNIDEADCDDVCSTECANTIEGEGSITFWVDRGAGICNEHIEEECPDPVTIFSDLDPDFMGVAFQSSSVNNPDWDVELDNNKIIHGTSACSFVDDSVPSTLSGQFCYCGFTGYDDGVNASVQPDMTTWFQYGDMGDMQNCLDNCANECTNELSDGNHITYNDVGLCYLNSTYSVTYSCNGGTGSTIDQNSYSYHDTVTVLSNSCTKADYTFSYWSCDQGVGNQTAGATFSMPGANVTCTAQWVQTNYTVSFAAGTNGSGTMPSQTNKHYRDTITLPANSFTAQTGYTFNGWNCNQGIGNKVAGATFSMPAANVTCTAQWTQNNYTVSFAAGTNGSGTMSSQTNKHYGDTITLPANGFTPTSGYMFTGWNCNQGIGNKAVGSTFPMPAANVTCTAQWTQITYPFTLTTTNLPANDRTFYFNISAAGTFYVDCGSGGQLSGDTGSGVSGNTITKNDTTLHTYTCTYSTSGAKTIRFGGLATAYDTLGGSNAIAAIDFYSSSTKVASIGNNSNLSTIFPYLGSNDGQYPRFVGTFTGCTNLTSIPNTLFSSLTGSGESMFSNTFANSGLTSIPSDLFNFNGNNVSGADFMFLSTFNGCTGLTGANAIPSNLFSRVISGAQYLFSNTFANSGLTSIPSGLFNFNGNNVSGANYMFSGTFASCTGLTGANAIPSNLFSRVTSGAQGLFSDTFGGCSGLTQLPSGLFGFGGNTVAGAQNMFNGTFSGCSGLTQLPNNLFTSFSSAGAAMFLRTFGDCSGLTSLPSNLFRFTNNISNVSYVFYGIFSGCSGLTSLPNDLFDLNNHTISGGDETFAEAFRNCSNLTTLPNTLFSHVAGAGQGMFGGTFGGCTSLTSIPGNLFNFNGNNSVSGQPGMFIYTFMGCTGLTSLPDGLFARITYPANGMFEGTFADCTGLTGYIPTDFFAGLVANGSNNATNLMTNIFSNTGSLATSCPSGTTQYITGYESYWNSHVSCQASSYTITYHDTSDCSTALSGLTPTTYTSSAAVSLPTPTRTGYTCNGWNGCTNGNISASTGWAAGTITGNVAVYKNCTGNNIPVYFDSDSSSCNYGSTLTVPQPTRTGYVFTGWKLQCSLYGLETALDGIDYGYVDGNSNSNNAGGYNLTRTNTFATEFDWGTVYGEARCSTTSGTTQGQHGTPSTTTGEYCWCAINAYTPTVGERCTISHTNWVYMDEPGPLDCENVCAMNCAEGIQNSSGFREAAFGHI